MRRALQVITSVSSKAFMLTGVAMGMILAGPFLAVGCWLDERADDLEAGYRRGGAQNWLWRWAHRRKELGN